MDPLIGAGKSNFTSPSEKKEDPQAQQISNIAREALLKPVENRYEAVEAIEELPFGAFVYYQSSRFPATCLLENYPGARHVKDVNDLKIVMIDEDQSPEGLKKYISDKYPERMQPFEGKEKALEFIKNGGNPFVFWVEREGHKYNGKISDKFGVLFLSNNLVNNFENKLSKLKIDAYDSERTSFPEFRLASIEERLALLNSIVKVKDQHTYPSLEEAKSFLVQQITSYNKLSYVEQDKYRSFSSFAFYTKKEEDGTLSLHLLNLRPGAGIPKVTDIMERDYTSKAVITKDLEEVLSMQESLNKDWNAFIQGNSTSPSKVDAPLELGLFEVTLDPSRMISIQTQKDRRFSAINGKGWTK